ncbi:YbbR-like domain-containing protein [Neolewinella persica]|uniref:hypothetical protein n=1 Tax=Neolewinella persica TaxID=70998 RepID=UPI0012FC4AF8|nr:hypothetical protein [Neolewinella persica]
MPFTLKTLTSKNPLGQMTPEDRNILLICLGAALVFWLILNLSRDYDINRSVEVNYLVDPERVLVGRMPEQLEAKVNGNGWNLIWESMRPGNLPVEIDVRNRDNLRLTSTDLLRQISRKLSSSKLTPELPGFESIPILTTPKEGKRVPIVSKVKLQFAEGHMALEAPVITPDSITITGATDALEGVEEWPTLGLILKDVNEDIDNIVGLEPSEEGITLSRQEVRVQLNVEAFIQEKITVPVTVENAPVDQAFEYSPKEVQLVISLPQRAFGSFRPSDFLLVADLSGHASGTSYNTVPLTLVRKPGTVVGARFSPRVVEYYLVE